MRPDRTLPSFQSRPASTVDSATSRPAYLQPLKIDPGIIFCCKDGPEHHYSPVSHMPM